MDRSARRFHWDLFGIFYVELSGSPGSYRPAVPQLNQVGSQGAFVRRYPTIAFVCGRCSAFPFDTAGRRASFFGEIHFLVKKNFWLNLNQFSDPSTYVEGFVLGRSFDKRLADNHLKLGRRHRQFIDWRCCRRVEVVRIMGGLSCEQDVGSRWDASSRCKSSQSGTYDGGRVVRWILVSGERGRYRILRKTLIFRRDFAEFFNKSLNFRNSRSDFDSFWNRKMMTFIFIFCISDFRHKILNFGQI